MLKIRLQRTGRVHSPSYRVVVVEHTRGPKAGDIVEKVGSYNPKTKEQILHAERIKHWISVGAQPSDTLHNMLITAGIITGKKINVLPKKTAPKKETPAEESAAETSDTAPADEPAPAADEAMTEETPAEDPAKE